MAMVAVGTSGGKLQARYNGDQPFTFGTPVWGLSLSLSLSLSHYEFMMKVVVMMMMMMNQHLTTLLWHRRMYWANIARETERTGLDNITIKN